MTDGAAELAVLIVNYRTGGHLARCLDSLAARRGDLAVETIVVDNASGDGSADAARGRPAVRLVENDRNVFLSPAWNQAARLTRAPWLLFLNPDTELRVGTLADLVAAGRATPRAGIVGPMLRDPDGSIYTSGRAFPRIRDAVGHALLGSIRPGNRFTRRYHLDGWDRTTARDVDWVSGAAMLMPREAYEAVGGFDERFLLYGEELDIATRLRATGWSVRYEPSVEVMHVGGVSTGRGAWSLRLHADSIFRYYRLHRARGWRILTLPFAWVFLRSWAMREARR
ncbi:MAG: glycosyltransferase family 2 protein [Actinomycetota bacterium]